MLNINQSFHSTSPKYAVEPFGFDNLVTLNMSIEAIEEKQIHLYIKHVKTEHGRLV